MNFRISPDEADLIDLAAAAMHMKPSSFSRFATLQLAEHVKKDETKRIPVTVKEN